VSALVIRWRKPQARAHFTDIAQKGRTYSTGHFRRENTKNTSSNHGNRLAIFDYDNDGWPDIFFINGTKLKGASGKAPTSHLYHNNHDGTFIDVTKGRLI